MSPSADEREPSPVTRLVPRLLGRLIFRSAAVHGNRIVGPGLRLITLQGPQLRGLRWQPGDKLQIRVDQGLTTRAFTPTGWDERGGRTQLLVHSLSWGPGSVWARKVDHGDRVDFIGPRRSLDLAALDPADTVLVGDETSVALAASWRPALCVLEVINGQSAQAMLEALALDAVAVERRDGGQHLDDMVAAMLEQAGPQTRFVLTGRERTIGSLLQSLRRAGVSPRRILAKSFWSEQRTGMD